MIDNKYRREDLIGRKCRSIHDIQNGAGDGIGASTICTITDVVRGKGITLKTDRCKVCGQYTYIRGVNRTELELVKEEPEESRDITLLRACLDLLNQYKESPFELEILGKTIHYDGSECDGYCLIDDLEDYLFMYDHLNK